MEGVDAADVGHWQSYPDATVRMTYPPLQTKGGNPNAVASEGVIAAVASQVQRSQRREAEFRAQQYARRLKTRGVAAMRDPTPPALPPAAPPVPIPTDPEAQAYHAAGWI